jgi:hypothetical protein
MTRWLLLCSVCALAGCAPALLPPVTHPLPDSPAEYYVVPARWQAHTVLTYRTQYLVEHWVGDRRNTKRGREVAQSTVVERTPLGNLWVRVTLDGAEAGHVLLDGEGQVVGQAPTPPAEALVDAIPQSPGAVAVQEYASRTLRRYETVQVTVPAAGYRDGLPPWLQAVFVERVAITLTYIGLVQWGESVVAAILWKAPHLLQRPVCIPEAESPDQECLAAHSAHGIVYRDPASGHLLAEYGSSLTTGTLRDRPGTMRIRTIFQSTLDREESQGW